MSFEELLNALEAKADHILHDLSENTILLQTLQGVTNTMIATDETLEALSAAIDLGTRQAGELESLRLQSEYFEAQLNVLELHARNPAFPQPPDWTSTEGCLDLLDNGYRSLLPHRASLSACVTPLSRPDSHRASAAGGSTRGDSDRVSRSPKRESLRVTPTTPAYLPREEVILLRPITCKSKRITRHKSRFTLKRSFVSMNGETYQLGPPLPALPSTQVSKAEVSSAPAPSAAPVVSLKASRLRLALLGASSEPHLRPITSYTALVPPKATPTTSTSHDTFTVRPLANPSVLSPVSDFEKSVFDPPKAWRQSIATNITEMTSRTEETKPVHGVRAASPPGEGKEKEGLPSKSFGTAFDQTLEGSPELGFPNHSYNEYFSQSAHLYQSPGETGSGTAYPNQPPGESDNGTARVSHKNSFAELGYPDTPPNEIIAETATLWLEESLVLTDVREFAYAPDETLDIDDYDFSDAESASGSSTYLLVFGQMDELAQGSAVVATPRSSHASLLTVEQFQQLQSAMARAIRAAPGGGISHDRPSALRLTPLERRRADQSRTMTWLEQMSQPSAPPNAADVVQPVVVTATAAAPVANVSPMGPGTALVVESHLSKYLAPPKTKDSLASSFWVDPGSLLGLYKLARIPFKDRRASATAAAASVIPNATTKASPNYVLSSLSVHWTLLLSRLRNVTSLGVETLSRLGDPISESGTPLASASNHQLPIRIATLRLPPLIQRGKFHADDAVKGSYSKVIIDSGNPTYIFNGKPLDMLDDSSPPVSGKPNQWMLDDALDGL